LLLNKTINDTCDALKGIAEFSDNNEFTYADLTGVKDILNKLKTGVTFSIDQIKTIDQETKKPVLDVLRKFDDSIGSVLRRLMTSEDESKIKSVHVEEAVLELVYSFEDLVGQTNLFIKNNAM
jgi:hypothetical protein